MKVYIGASRVDIEAAREVAVLFRRYGHEVTSSWLSMEEAIPEDDRLLTPEESAEMTTSCLSELAQADTFVLVRPEKGGCGCWVELGFALTTHEIIWILGTGPRRSAFETNYGIEHFATMRRLAEKLASFEDEGGLHKAQGGE